VFVKKQTCWASPTVSFSLEASLGMARTSKRHALEHTETNQQEQQDREKDNKTARTTDREKEEGGWCLTFF
jgi:hypothetical protein